MAVLRNLLLVSIVIASHALIMLASPGALAQEPISGTRIALPVDMKGLFARNGSTEGDDGRPGAPSSQQEPLTAEEIEGLPVAKQSKVKGSRLTKYRVEVGAEVKAPLGAVLDFYGRELGKRANWRKLEDAPASAGSARVSYETPEGPALLTLTEEAGTTAVNLAVRKRKEAEASGLLPKPGHVRFLVPIKDTQLSLAAGTIRISAMEGAEPSDLPTIEIGPGSYVVRVDVEGLDVRPETVDAGPDDIWGLALTPMGVMPIQIY